MKVSFFSRRAAKNAGWLVAGRILHMALAFLVNLLTARYLGPSNYGLVNYAALYTAFFTSFATLGLSSLLLKDFMDDPEGTGTTVGTAIAMRLLSSTLSAVSILAIVAAVDRGERLTMTVVALYSMSLIFQAFDTIQYWFQSRLESKYATIATSVGYIIVSFYKVLLLVLGKDVRWFAISNTIDYAVAAIVFLGLYKWRGGPRLHISPAKGRALLRQSGSFILCGLMVSVYNCTDRFMLKHLLDEASVGYYATATSLATVWTFVLSAIIDSITPGIMQAHRTDQAQFVRHNRQLYALVFYFSVAVSAVITLLARPAVSLLYGEAYLPAVRPMQVITWYTAFSYLGVARAAWVVCEGKQKYLTPLYIGSALVNVALNFLLIPCWGATGAAVASLLTQISTTFVFPLLLRPLRPNGLLMCQAVLLRDVFPKRKKTDNSQRKAC